MGLGHHRWMLNVPNGTLFCHKMLPFTFHFRSIYVPWETPWNEDGTKMERRWNENGTKMERRWNENGTKMERRRPMPKVHTIFNRNNIDLNKFGTSPPQAQNADFGLVAQAAQAVLPGKSPCWRSHLSGPPQDPAQDPHKPLS